MNDEQPPEPDWDELADKLREAGLWLLSEDGLDQPNCIVRREAVGIALGTITGVQSGEDNDTTVRLFFEHINRAACWVIVDDEALERWVRHFCVNPERIAAQMLSADAKGEA